MKEYNRGSLREVIAASRYLEPWSWLYSTLNCSERFCLKAKLAAMRCLQLLWNILNQVPDTTESRQKSSEQAGFRLIMRLPRRVAGNSKWGGCFGGVGAEPPALKNFALFCKNNPNFGAISVKSNAFRTWHRNWQRTMIQLVALMGYMGSG